MSKSKVQIPQNYIYKVYTDRGYKRTHLQIKIHI